MMLKGNIANGITGLRILASFFYLVWALKQDWRVAFVIFTIAAGTDLVDGMVARLFHQRTRLGAFLDPTADKLLMFFGFLSLTRAGLIPVGLFLLVVARDLMISLGILCLKLKRIPLVYRPTYLSKATTLAQILLLVSVHAEAAHLFQARGLPVLMGSVLVLTTLTGVQYVIIGLRILKGSHGA